MLETKLSYKISNDVLSKQDLQNLPDKALGLLKILDQIEDFTLNLKSKLLEELTQKQ